MREIQPISNPGPAEDRYILLKRGQKKPAKKGWQSQAYSRTDPELLAHLEAGGNIGMLTGNGLVVVDLDERPGTHSGAASWAEWCAQNGDDPQDYQPATVTPSGGRHIYFSVPSGISIPNRVGVKPGIDIKSSGGYVVVPPSRLSNGEYIDAGGPIYPAPSWLIEEIAVKPAKAEAEADVSVDDGVVPSSTTPENPQVSRLEAFAVDVDEVLTRLASLYQSRDYWQAVWFDQLLPDGKSPSQRDIHLAYWLFRAGYSYEEVECLMSTCPAVVERPIHAGRQRKPWGRESYRQATLEKARKLAIKHASVIASRAAGNKSEIDAVLEKDEVYQALTEIAKRRKYAVDARVAMKVREVQLKSGRAVDNREVTVSWSMMQIPESSLLRHRPSENRFLEVVSISRQRGRASAYRLRLDAIREASKATPTRHLRVYNTYLCGDTPSLAGTHHDRIQQVADLRDRGLTYAEIASRLGISTRTAKRYVALQRQQQAQPQPQPEKEIQARSIDILDPASPFILQPYLKEANKLADTIAATLANLGHGISDNSKYKIRDAILKAAQSLALDYSISPDHDWLEYSTEAVIKWLTHRQAKHRPSNDSIIHKLEDILGFMVYCEVIASDKKLSEEFKTFHIQLLSSLQNKYAHIPYGRAMLRFSQARKYQFQRYLERKIRQTITLAIAA